MAKLGKIRRANCHHTRIFVPLFVQHISYCGISIASHTHKKTQFDTHTFRVTRLFPFFSVSLCVCVFDDLWYKKHFKQIIQQRRYTLFHSERSGALHHIAIFSPRLPFSFVMFVLFILCATWMKIHICRELSAVKLSIGLIIVPYGQPFLQPVNGGKTNG